MKVYGYVTWFGPEKKVFDEKGKVITDRWDEPLIKRKIGINADVKFDDGTVFRERFVTETDLSFSDNELEEWRDKKVMREILLHFDEKVSKSGNHFQNVNLIAVNPIELED